MTISQKHLPTLFLACVLWSVGSLTTQANPTVTPGGGIFIGPLDSEIGGLAGPGIDPNGHDQTQVLIAADVSASNLNVQGFNAFLPAQGNSFQIISDLLGNPIRVTGTFTGVTFDADGVGGIGLPVTNAAIVFDVNTGAITATGLNGPTSTFADLGTNPNQSGAATAIFNAANVGPTTTPNQIDSLTIAGQLALQIIDATGTSAGDLARYVPDYYGSLADYALLGDQVLARSIQDRVTPFNYVSNAASGEDRRGEQPEHASVFFNYMYSSLDTPDNATVNRNDFMVGSNLIVRDNFVAGIAGSLSEGRISAPLGSAESQGFGGMIYARGVLFEDFTIFGSLGYSQQDFDLRRLTVNGTVTGSTDAATYTGFFGIQHKGWQFGELSIVPRISASYSQTDIGGFSETGAIDALNVGGFSANLFTGEAGLAALWTTELLGRALNLELAIAMKQAFQDNKDQMNVSIINVPAASYPVTFADRSSSQAVVRFNASCAIAQSVTAYAGYEGHYGGQDSHYIKGGLRINF